MARQYNISRPSVLYTRQGIAKMFLTMQSDAVVRWIEFVKARGCLSLVDHIKWDETKQVVALEDDTDTSTNKVP